jgi:COMPASS component SPP1
VQKRSDAEWERVKELAAAERSSSAKRKKGRDRDRSTENAEQPVRSREAPAATAAGANSKRTRRTRSADGDDEGSIFCICRSPEEYGFMIACDKCNEWFHGGCVGLTPVYVPCLLAQPEA